MDYAKLHKVIASAETTTQKDNAERYRKLFYAKLLRIEESASSKERVHQVFSIAFVCVGFVCVVLAFVA